MGIITKTIIAFIGGLLIFNVVAFLNWRKGRTVKELIYELVMVNIFIVVMGTLGVVSYWLYLR